jgi:uncharacterized pyridoxal phosphate-containing UPF0001 family protein
MIESYQDIKKLLDSRAVTLVTVSKMRTTDEVIRVYNEGQRVFGENKVQNCSINERNCLQILNGILLDTCKPIK